MEGKKPEQQRKDSSSSRGRFEAMSWLYRDGLSYQPLTRPKTPDLPKRSADRVTSRQSPSPTKEVPTKPIEQSRGDRFKSMSWLYRDGLQGKGITSEQRTPVSKPRVGDKSGEMPIVSDIATVPSLPKRPSKQTGITPTTNNDKYEAMRWLYEDDASFQKAVQELKAEEAAVKLKKEQAKQARKDRIQKVRASISAQKKRVVQYARTEPKKALIGGGVAAVVLVVIVFGSIGMSRDGDADASKVAGDAVVKQTDPEFDTLLPNNDSSQAESAIAYDERFKVATYIDEVDSQKIAVSQQQLPERFTVNQAVELEKFAKEINASQFIQAGDTKAYAGLSIEGPQTVVLIKNDLLIFLKADKEISTGAWMAYIESLE